ncbi:MAG: hypothetical protein Kow0059_11860 [Candidatus Sumerlaeia bacterium]
MISAGTAGAQKSTAPAPASPAATRSSEASGTEGALESGSITLPWAEAEPVLKQLFVPDEPNRPPAPYLLESAAWTGELKDTHVELTAECILMVLDPDGWVKAPVASAQAIIKDVQLDGHPVGLFEEGGFLHVVTNEPGRHTLTLTLQAAVSGSGKSSGSARFPLAPFPRNSLTLRLPTPDYEFTIPQSAAVEVSKTDGGGGLVSAVFGRSPTLDLRWERRVTVAEGAKLPTKISARVFSLFSVGEGLVSVRDRVGYSILHNPVATFKVQVPVRTTVTSVEGSGVKGWKMEPPAADKDKKAELGVLEITFAKDVMGEGEFFINREMPLKEDMAELIAPMIQPMGVERYTGWVGVSAAANVECKVAEAQKLTQTDVEEAPALLSQMSSDPLVLTFKWTDGPIALRLALRRFQTLPVLATIVDHADYTILFTEDGKLLTRAVFQTRNNRNQYLQVTLPEKATVWSSFVAGQPVKPAMDDKGRLLLVLKKSFTLHEQTQAFPVEIVYLQELEKFQTRARLTISLARPDVPVSRAFATLLAPRDFKLRGFSGTLKPLDGPEPEYLPGPVVAQTPAVTEEAGRRTAGLGIARMAPAASPKESAEPEQQIALGKPGTPFFGTQPQEKANAFDLYTAPTMPADEKGTWIQQMRVSRGLLPIPIDIPSVGRPYYFGKILTTDEAFEITFTYRTKWLF